MKTKWISVLVLALLFVACAPKSQYQTSTGKKKLKYYNALQFGKEKNPKKTF